MTRRALIRSVVVIVVALLFASGGVADVYSGRVLAVDGLLIVALVTIAAVAATGAPFTFLVHKLTGTEHPRGTPVAARAVMAAAITIGVGSALLGASFAARPDTEAQLQRTLQALPTLPPNTALVRLDAVASESTTRPAYAAMLREPMSNELRAALAAAVPEATIIELRSVGTYYQAGTAQRTMTCPSCATTIIVQNNQLNDVYGTKPKYGIGTYTFAPQKKLPDHAPAISRFPDHRALRYLVVRHRKLPPARFDGARFGEVPVPFMFVNNNIPTYVRGVFVRAPHDLSPADLERLKNVVTTAAVPAHSQLQLIGPQGVIVGPPIAQTDATTSAKFRISRRAPWAASTTASRTVVVVIAALVALIAAVLTEFIRRDARRAAALHAAGLLAFLGVGITVVTTVLVRRGTNAFTNHNRDMPIPFTVPWGAAALFVFVLPIVGAGLAALVARPDRGAFDR